MLRLAAALALALTLGAAPVDEPRPDPLAADSLRADSLRADTTEARPASAAVLAAEAEATRAAVDEILRSADLPSAFWGLYVQDLSTGRILLSRNADKLFLPASTQKLFTTATALDALGPDFRYTTRLYFFGDERTDGVLRGDLVIRGAGDPTFGSDLTSEDPLQRWAEALHAAGVRRIQGRLIGDDDRFEDAPYGEGWDVSHISTESYAPAAGGLAWDDNLLALRIAGGTVESSPRGFATFRGQIGTGAGRLRVERTLGADEFALSGSVSSGYRGSLQVPVANPTRYAVWAFAERLREAGIAVDAELVDVDDLRAPLDYDGAEPLQVAVSPTLDRIIRRVNRESDNLYAEQVFRTLTPSGTVDAASRRVRAFIDEAGADGDDLSIVDGSGLSRKDMVTPAAMAAVLSRMHRHPAGAAFRASLPEGGGAGSTLRNRLSGVPVRAKTGSLQAVRCLAGYVDGPSGNPMVFVLFANNYTTRAGAISRAQDQIVRALAAGGRLPVDED